MHAPYQTYDLMHELQRRCTRVLNSVQARMGFVPGTIRQEVDYLLSMQGPMGVELSDARQNPRRSSTEEGDAER